MQQGSPSTWSALPYPAAAAAVATTCVEVRELSFALVDGELARGDAAAVRGHVDECSLCRQVLARDEAFVRWMRSRVAPAATPPSLRARIGRLLDAAARTPVDAA